MSKGLGSRQRAILDQIRDLQDDPEVQKQAGWVSAWTLGAGESWRPRGTRRSWSEQQSIRRALHGLVEMGLLERTPTWQIPGGYFYREPAAREDEDRDAL